MTSTSDSSPLITADVTAQANDISSVPNPVSSGHDEQQQLIAAEIETGPFEQNFSWKKLWRYTGPGVLMSIAYLDPGNLEADLQTGAVAGYSLLWLLLYAHIAGLLIQCLSARLGVVTGRHLAQSIRAHYPRPLSIILYLIAEIAITGADIQEIIGTAIALRIIFGFPLWIGTLLTTMDTFTFMLLQNYGIRKLEAFFMALIAMMGACFWIELILSRPNVEEIARGILVPVIPSDAIVQAVALIGAVIMPHNLYLHSALVMTRKTDRSSKEKLKEASFYFEIESGIALFCSYLINLAIVVVFASVFYNSGKEKKMPGLFDAGDFLYRTLGSGARFLWALGLLAAGQSSTIAGTLAGQYVMEGYFGKIFKKPWHRIAVTRSISLIPSMLVAVFAADHFDNMGELLNVLQSLCLPTALIPILKLTSSTAIMGSTFRTRRFWRLISWGIASILIGFNVFLFFVYLQDLQNKIFGYIFGGLYLLLIIYISILPVRPSQDLPKDANLDGYKPIDGNEDEETNDNNAVVEEEVAVEDSENISSNS